MDFRLRGHDGWRTSAAYTVHPAGAGFLPDLPAFVAWAKHAHPSR
jgi:hypothetical protein